MFDTRLRPLVDRLTVPAGQALARRGISANAVSIAGAVLGLAGAALVSQGWFLSGLGLFVGGRLADGLDGAVARAQAGGATDWGGYLDIVLDFAVYAAMPLAFAFVAPEANGFAAALLLASFLVNGSAFLAFATLAGKRGLVTTHQGQKSIYYLSGLAEGAETIAVFSIACVWPQWFAVVAIGFAALCLISAAARVWQARQMLD